MKLFQMNDTLVQEALPDPLRIVIVGSSASGKTTLARTLSERLDIPHVELDALHWGPGWTPHPKEQFREAAIVATLGETWVADGNYSVVRDLVWGRANLLVWLDYNMAVNLGRLVHRTVRRLLTREELWNGNRERLRDQFARDNLFYWVLTRHHKKRREYPLLLKQPEYAHLKVYRFTAPAQTREWLEKVTSSDTALGRATLQ